MPKIEVSGLSNEEKQLIEEAADKVGMGNAEFVRTRFRAGYRLWNAGGDFDTSEMQSRLNNNLDAANIESQTKSSEPATATKKDRFTQQIKRNLPSDEADALSREEIENLVKSEVVGDVLAELIEAGEVEYDPRQEGYVRK